MEKNNVIFKGRKDGLSIILGSDTSFDEILKEISEKIKETKGFFSSTNTLKVDLKGRELSEDEKTEVIKILAAETGLEVSLTQFPDVEAKRPAQKLAVLSPNSGAEQYSDTYYYFGTLRSGQFIHYEGSVTIVGNVNSGAEILATGNVIVLGELKGIVHAGAKGDNNCFIFNLLLKTSQIRIGTVLSYIPPETLKDKNLPIYAFVQGGKINIEYIK